ncbi:hypothetical protein HN748_03245 [Candidatus Peregrinibacteria bacterium]|nr:hypothetical protein [Candidatus Peregrinibacteria bacterium]
MEFKASEFENDIARSYDHFERAHGEDKRSKQEQILSRIRSAVAGLGTQQGDCPLTILSEKMEGEEVVVEFGGENCG